MPKLGTIFTKKSLNILATSSSSFISGNGKLIKGEEVVAKVADFLVNLV